MIIIERKRSGERECVHSLDGYDKRQWRVVEEGVTRPRGHCVREGGRWRIDREKHGQRQVAVSAAELDEMRARLAAIEKGGE